MSAYVVALAIVCVFSAVGFVGFMVSLWRNLLGQAMVSIGICFAMAGVITVLISQQITTRGYEWLESTSMSLMVLGTAVAMVGGVIRVTVSQRHDSSHSYHDSGIEIVSDQGSSRAS